MMVNSDDQSSTLTLWYLFTKKHHNAWHNKAHSPIARIQLTIIATVVIMRINNIRLPSIKFALLYNPDCGDAETVTWNTAKCEVNIWNTEKEHKKEKGTHGQCCEISIYIYYQVL